MGRYPDDMVQAAIAGDRQTIEALLRLAQSDIRRYARRTCRTTSDVEDAVQETLFILYRHIGGLRQVAALSGWLFAIVHRQCLRLARAAMGSPDDFNEIELERRLAALPLADLRVDVANAIQSLPPRLRDVVLLRDVEEQSIGEIAAHLTTTREAVKGRLHRARKLLRDYLKQ